MTRDSKNKILVFFGLAAIAMVLLASGVANILRPPETFINASGRVETFLDAGGTGFSINVIWVVIIFLAIYVVALVSLFITPEGRRRFLVFIVLMAAIILALSLIPPREPEIVETSPTEVLPDQDGILDAPIEPTPVVVVLDQAPASIEWLITIAGVVVAAILVGFVVLTVILVFRNRQKISITEAIGEQAQRALNDLEAGYDYQNVIIRCYAEMSQVLLVSRGVEREIGMTPHEFENTLIRNRFPSEPVKNLTLLFEEVRYGGVDQSAGRIEQAKISLGEIITFCQQSPETLGAIP